jgi:hypothetical protein
MKNHWFDTIAHHCNHQYTHCMSCCILTGLTNNPNCAKGAQFAENVWDYRRKGRPDKNIWRLRDEWCAAGISVAQNGFGQALGRPGDKYPYPILPGWYGACSAGCSAKYPDPKPDTQECREYKEKNKGKPPKLPPIKLCEPEFWTPLENPRRTACNRHDDGGFV